MFMRFYRIISSHADGTGLSYVGRTTMSLVDCLQSHIKSAAPSRKRKGTFVQAIRALGFSTFKIELLEEGDYETFADIQHREMELIIQNDSIRKGWNCYHPPRKTRVEPMTGGMRDRFLRIKELTAKIDRIAKKPAEMHRVQMRNMLRMLQREAHALAMLSIKQERERREKKGYLIHIRPLELLDLPF